MTTIPLPLRKPTPTTNFLLPHPPTSQTNPKTQSIDLRQPQTPTNTAPPAPTPPNNTNSNTNSSLNPNFNSNSTPAPQPKPTSAMGEANGSNTPLGDLSGLSATQVRPGGAPARVYLNEKIVPHLLEGMKSVAREQPANPLRVLGEFLLQKSNEVEGEGKKDSE
ncbi:hypothetical protein PENARI_c002G05763 [Penicillium arizonense]|uniref:Uncharacterized protein n=1 Tax=Penicillium arizonense TaxID=1835702 RepID=A0A1F5LVA4_PENAI|nr:hypothetical protein PENARI_c002G05763 [Penicillium arizonense]OGE56851.1 hypothetical protein PENARI_c002G05763 [Penicillium arizonense]